LSSYLSTAFSFSGVQVHLVDGNGSIVAANQPLLTAIPTLTHQNAPLATALRGHRHGSYTAGGQRWRYSSTAIEGTPWHLSAAVREEVLFASLANNEIAGRAALGGAAGMGLLVVAGVGRTRRSRRDLQLSEQRFRKMFDGSRIGMTLTDTQGRFLRVNPAACRMFGRTEKELVTLGFADVTHPDDIEAAATHVRDCMAGRIDGFEFDKRYVHAEGRTVDASITSTLLRDQDGRPQYFASQIIDTTDRRALEQARRRDQAELVQRAEQMQKANIHLGDVMAMLTHDVRQPLASILGIGELLLEDWPDATDQEKHHDVQRMTAAGNRANTLVTDILTLAQLDAGALVARPARVDLSHAVREAITAQQASDPTPVTVLAPDETSGLADPAHLQLILGNLLTNATKYGRPPFAVTVTNRRQHIEIRISDHGDGVPETFVPHLFERFARADTGVATTTAGTGLGLYLVHQLAEAGGLDISYQPHQPHGAVFLIKVPYTPARALLSDPRRHNPVSSR
jgi:PAS domain S-box-containing protein